jgi:membrane fusion protein (multidrug efflux system)
MQDVYVAFGEFRAHRSVDVPARAGGQLAGIMVTEGQKVAAGDLIAQIDDELAQANLSNAKVLLDLAQSKYDRVAKLQTSGVSSTAALDDARSSLVAAKSQVDLSRSQVEFLKIKAPFAGTIASLPPSLGSYLQTGQVIAKLIDATALEADFAVPFDLAGTIAIGSRFTVRAIGPVAWSAQATVTSVDPEVDRATRTIRLHGRLENADLKIRPGSIVRIELVTAERPDAIAVPETAVLTSLAGTFVYRIVDGAAARTPVVLGTRRNGVVEIMSGIALGDTVVTDGRQKVQQGTPVTVASAAGA